MPATGLVHTLIERTALRFGEGAHAAEIAAAREEFYTQTGRVFEDDGELYEQRTAAFLEWYVCERPLRGSGRTPALTVLEDDSDRLDPEQRRALAAVASSHRSLFEVGTVNESAVELRDLLGGARFSVRERRSTIGFHPQDLLEARLIWSGNDVVFGKTYLFHPREAREEIASLIEAAGAGPERRQALLQLLARLQLRWHRQGHVAAARLYREALAPRPA